MPKRKQNDMQQGRADDEPIEELASDELTFAEDGTDDDEGFSISEEEDDEDEDEDPDDAGPARAF